MSSLQIVLLEYEAMLKRHIAYVQEAGQKVHVPAHQLEVHDASKWSHEEYYAYAVHFKGGGAPEMFASAWLHHLHNNPHHWQYWLFADNFHVKDSGMVGSAVKMPENYAREMIADWMGASREYQGTWDMTDWLANKIPTITLHPSTAQSVKKILIEELDYKFVSELDFAKP